MKKNLYVAVVILFVCCFTSLAFAGLKAPKTVCWGLSGSGIYNGGTVVLNFKKSGMKTKTQDGNVKFYYVQGAIGHSDFAGEPVTGTAYADIVDNQIEGIISGGDITDPVHCKIFINLDNPDTITCKSQSELTIYGYSITELDCQTVSVY